MHELEGLAPTLIGELGMLVLSYESLHAQLAFLIALCLRPPGATLLIGAWPGESPRKTAGRRGSAASQPSGSMARFTESSESEEQSAPQARSIARQVRSCASRAAREASEETVAAAEAGAAFAGAAAPAFAARCAAARAALLRCLEFFAPADVPAVHESAGPGSCCWLLIVCVGSLAPKTFRCFAAKKALRSRPRSWSSS